MKIYNFKILHICMVLKMLLLAGTLQAQPLKGIVYTIEKNKKEPLPGAVVRWQSTQKGTTTGLDGRFLLERPDSTPRNLVVSYIGHITDTIYITTQKYLEIGLNSGYQLQEVVIMEERQSSFMSKVNVGMTEVVTKRELLRAACCNLSESFETNPSIDVNFTDAVSGAKQIRMLGLEGVYTQMLQENMPGLRGLAASYGLTFVPGTWIESIQITKGAGSVVNGFESMGGQINLELIKPRSEEKLLFNAYADHMSRAEVNLNFANEINEKWGTATLLHGSGSFMKFDQDNDKFLDAPLFKQFSGLHRWNYNDGQKYESQFGISGTYQQRQGGQLDFKPEQRGTTLNYGIGVESRRLEAFGKFGVMYPEKPYKSIGNIISVTHHDQQSFFGLRNYSGQQNTLYINHIHQTIIRNTYHKIKFGAGLLADDYREKYWDEKKDSGFNRREIVPGAFTEYAYGDTLDFSFVAGFRADYHNLYGLMLTPRLHLRYNLGNNWSFRASGGRGYRTPNIWVENSGLFASSRKIVIYEAPEQEQSWNYGGSAIYNFEVKKKKGHISADYFYTTFNKQVVVDLYRHPQEIHIYNLTGKSFASSFQVEAQYDILKNLNAKAAYKIYDVKSTYNGELLQKPLVPRERFLATASYATRFKKWVFDATAMRYGKAKLPVTDQNPIDFKRNDYSDPYWIFHAQVTRNFKKWNIYLGSENLLNYRQPNAIVAANDPFGPYFDASMIWAPIDGRRIYAGLRYKIDK